MIMLKTRLLWLNLLLQLLMLIILEEMVILFCWYYSQPRDFHYQLTGPSKQFLRFIRRVPSLGPKHVPGVGIEGSRSQLMESSIFLFLL